jgi:hypothetical protein
VPKVASAPTIKYQYYQSSTAVNISVLAKNVSAEDAHVDFSPSHLKIRIRQDGSDGTIDNTLLKVPCAGAY